MAKSSQQEAKATEQKVHQAIIDIFMDSGWEAVTYGNIAKYTGLSRGGVQRIVANKDSMLMAFQGQIYDFFINKLDFSNEKTLLDSWQAGLLDKKFRHCLKYLVGSINADVAAKRLTKVGLDKLKEKIGETQLFHLLGLSVYHLIS